MLHATVVTGAAVSLMLGSLAWADNNVVVESKQVPANAEGVTVGVYFENDAALNGIVLPLEVREVTEGSYIKDTLVIDTLNRLADYLSEFVIIGYMSDKDKPSSRYKWCDGGEGFSTQDGPDFESPDALMYVGIRASDSAMPAGDDGTPPSGTPSLRIMFNVSNVAGTFEIDTTCVTPNNHILFNEREGHLNVTPAFTKGVIEIGCGCDCFADPECDTIINVFDVVAAVDVMNGGDPIPDPNSFCPVMTTDVDCDGDTDQTDVDKIASVAFYSGDPEEEFCSPCSP